MCANRGRIYTLVTICVDVPGRRRRCIKRISHDTWSLHRGSLNNVRARTRVGVRTQMNNARTAEQDVSGARALQHVKNRKKKVIPSESKIKVRKNFIVQFIWETKIKSQSLLSLNLDLTDASSLTSVEFPHVQPTDYVKGESKQWGPTIVGIGSRSNGANDTV